MSILVLIVCGIGAAFLGQGCNKEVPVDILTVTPTAAAPGHIIRIGVTEPGEKTEYRVMFADTTVRPLRCSPDGILTVMVPYLEPGLYTLAVIPQGDDSGCGILTFEIEPPVRVNGEEAKNLFNNVERLLEISEEYMLLSYDAIGGTPETLAGMSEGLEKCKSLIGEAREKLSDLSEADLEVLCQIIQGSNLGASIDKSLKAIENDYLTKYHEILGKVGPGTAMGNTEFFFAMTRLDLLSALLTDIRTVVKATKYTSLLANFVPALGQIVSVGAWSSLSILDKALEFADQSIDGLLPTDLKLVRLEVIPETGALLNPGESAFVEMTGTMGSQKPWDEVFVDMALNVTLDLLLPMFEDEARHLLDEIPGINTDLRTNYAKQMLDAIRDLLVDAGFDVADSIFPMPWEDVTQSGSLNVWRSDVPLNVDYYYFEPMMQIVTGFANLVPFFGDELSYSLQELMLDVLGEKSILTNEVITVDNEDIVSPYDRATGKIQALKSGNTMLHARAYRYDEVVDLLWLFPIEGWKYLKEDEEVEVPAGDSMAVNVALQVTVSEAADPVNSDLAESPVSGVVPGVFTTDGGSFEISVSPVDQNGDLLYNNLTVDNFSFSPIQVAPMDAPDVPVAWGTASPDSVETVLPGDPGKGVNVAIVLDSSGSMSGNDSTRERVVAAKLLVDRLGPNDRAAVFDFGAGNTTEFGYTRLLQDFTSDHTLLYQAIDRVLANGGTPLYESLSEIIDHMAVSSLSNLAVVVLTDGIANSDDLYDEVVVSARDASIPIFAVGLGYGVDFTQLQALSFETGGTFAASSDALGLQNLFDSIGVAVSAGRLIVHATGGFAPAIQKAGPYLISGELRTKISGLTIPTPFEFRVDVVQTGDGLKLKFMNVQ